MFLMDFDSIKVFEYYWYRKVYTECSNGKQKKKLSTRKDARTCITICTDSIYRFEQFV